MDHCLIVRIDVADDNRPAFETWLRTAFLVTPDVPGLNSDPVCYRALRVPTRYRTYQPTPAYTTFFRFTGDPAEVASTSRFADWWRDGVLDRFPWVTAQNWVVAAQDTGPPPPYDHPRVLLTQVQVADGHGDAWDQWYDEHHVPQASKVPAMFGTQNRRFRSIDVAVERWHCAPVPRSTHLVPILDDVVLDESTASPEFLALMADTQAQFAGAIVSAGSTICERFR